MLGQYLENTTLKRHGSQINTQNQSFGLKEVPFGTKVSFFALNTVTLWNMPMRKLGRGFDLPPISADKVIEIRTGSYNELK
ncbi:MAG: hypothetical protein ACJAUP_001321 [Cellvibrionaceae bacterium]|jgi:hypothetical protein